MNARLGFCSLLNVGPVLFVWSHFFMTSCTSAPTLQEAPQSDAFAPLQKFSAATGIETLKVVQSEMIEVTSSDMKLGTGLSYGPGSGLRLLSYSKDDEEAQFLYITDRGPNSDLPATDSSNIRAAKVFQIPSFLPSFGVITLNLKKKQAAVASSVSLTTLSGQKMTGLPLPQGSLGDTNELAFDKLGKPLAGDPNGIDPEAIDLDNKGNIYISEEYRPAVLRVEQRTGRVLDVFEPGKGLPEVFKFRRPNRGFEGLAVTPAGNLVALLQSTIALPQDPRFPGRDSATASPFVRGLRKNLAGGEVSQFAYPISGVFKGNAEAKIGDLLALNENLFLVVNQGKTKNAKHAAYLEVLDTSSACDLSQKKLANGAELEYVPSIQELSKVCMPARVQTVLNLADLGWKHLKTEGLAQLDAQTLVLINDNDFGVGEEGPDAKTELLIVKFNRPILDALADFSGSAVKN